MTPGKRNNDTSLPAPGGMCQEIAPFTLILFAKEFGLACCPFSSLSVSVCVSLSLCAMMQAAGFRFVSPLHIYVVDRNPYSAPPPTMKFRESNQRKGEKAAQPTTLKTIK